jgi:uncharacterized protein (DUF433 family)
MERESVIVRNAEIPGGTPCFRGTRVPVDHECRTVVECGWSGKENGELLALAHP